MSKYRTYQELKTDGWFLKVGDVYSNPYESSHFKITMIELEEGCRVEDAFVYGVRVHPTEHSKRVIDPDIFEEVERHRAWYVNQEFDLETMP